MPHVTAVVSGIATHVVLHYLNPLSVDRPVYISLAIFALLRLAFEANPFRSHPTEIVLSLGVHILCTWVSIVCYRLSPLHPLARYPGPLLAKTTKFWGVWTCWTGRQHQVFLRLHRIHGDVVRTGPNELSIRNVAAVNQVLGSGGLQKGESYSTRTDPKAPGKNLIIMTGEPHANRRRLWNRGLGIENLREYEHIIAKRTTQLVQYLQNAARSGNVDITRAIGFFTFDFMGDMAFGGPFNMLADGTDKAGLWDALDRFNVTSALVTHIPWASRFVLKVPIISGYLKALRKFGVEMAMARMKAGSKEKDLWYHLSDEAELEKQRPPLSDIVSDGLLAVIAGSDTTAGALSSFFYFLLRNPDCYQKLKDEVDAVYPAGTDATDVTSHDKLVWMDACLNETVRLQPPLPTGGPRQVPYNTQGATIAGCFVPPGTQVYVPPYILHRDPRYFSPSPNEYMPARWLSEPGDSKGTLNRSAFIPFSFGPANCVGRHLARMEMKIVITAMMQHFDFAFAKGHERNASEWLETVHDFFVTTMGPLFVEVTERA